MLGGFTALHGLFRAETAFSYQNRTNFPPTGALCLNLGGVDCEVNVTFKPLLTISAKHIPCYSLVLLMTYTKLVLEHGYVIHLQLSCHKHSTVMTYIPSYLSMHFRRTYSLMDNIIQESAALSQQRILRAVTNIECVRLEFLEQE